MRKLTETPFFIIGSARSGTTLLRFIISSHPRLFIPPETGFIPFLLKDPNQELTFVKVQDVIQRIEKMNPAWRNMVDDLSTFYEALPQPNLKFVLDALFQRKISAYGAMRWGDQTPPYIRYIPTLNEIFPTAQFIHLIRDGRDVALSTLKWRGIRRPFIDLHYALKNWAKDIERGKKAATLLGPERYLEVRYEDIVQQQKKEVAQICDFLNEEIHPDMLDHTKLAREVIWSGGPVKVRQPTSIATMYGWKRKLSPFEKKMADRIAGPALSTQRYELASIGPFTCPERLKLIALACKYRIFDTIRSMLYAIGILKLKRGKGYLRRQEALASQQKPEK